MSRPPVFPKPPLIAALLSWLSIVVAVPLAAARSNAPPAQTINGAHLSRILSLDAPWRFHPGDDPLFADPSLDDANWPQIPPGQTFSSLGLPTVQQGEYSWYRLHLHIVNATGPLALALGSPWGQPYQVFVNGQRVFESPGFATSAMYATPPQIIPLPDAPDNLIAVRFHALLPIDQLPVRNVRIGYLEAIRSAVALAGLRNFDDQFLVSLCLSLLYIGVVPMALILFVAQRDHAEYVWLGVFCLFGAVYLAVSTWQNSGALPFSGFPAYLNLYGGWAGIIASLEFLAHFARVRRVRGLRLVQALMLLFPPVALHHWPLYAYGLRPAGHAAWFLLGTWYLFRAYRRGQTECGLLLGPFAVFIAGNVFPFLAGSFPQLLPFPLSFEVGHVGFSLSAICNMVCLMGLVAVVLYRFLRVTREEQRTASELDAARQVQKIILPAGSETAFLGFRVETAYLPARQVGGDFFQILPLGDGGLLFVIGDVVGKGLPAALLVSVLVGAIRTAAAYTTDPAELLSILNERLVGRSSGGFSTALAARIDPDGTLLLANAGHVPPYLDGREIDLPGALPLGIVSGTQYETTRVSLAPSARLTFYSDGVVEAQNQRHELFGFERSRELSVRPAAEIAAAVQHFGQQDDITVVSIQRTPVSALVGVNV